MRVTFLSPAEREYLAAIEYYTEQSVDLAAAFLDDLDHAVALLGEHSHVGAPFDGEIRRLLLRRFHHSVIYSVEGEEVVIIAVQHQSHTRVDIRNLGVNISDLDSCAVRADLT